MLATLVIAGPAAAAAPVPFTMADEVDFGAGVFTFTATGELCASKGVCRRRERSRVRAVRAGALRRGNVLIRSTYTCDDGSGTFEMLKHLHLAFTASGFTTAGPVQILGGTGDYAGITGHGFTTGEVVGATGGGTTTGVVQLP
jgi:hypothetical protein